MYKKAFEEQLQMLKGEKKIDFKRAVFITENVYHKNTLNYQVFKETITEIGIQLKGVIRKKGLMKYNTILTIR